MLGDVSQAWMDHQYVDASAGAGLYLARHALFYLGLSKFLVDWKNNDNDNQDQLLSDLATKRRFGRQLHTPGVKGVQGNHAVGRLCVLVHCVAQYAPSQGHIILD
jgi:hypothetical protein